MTEPQYGRRGDRPREQYVPIESLCEADDLQQRPDEDDKDEPTCDDVRQGRQHRRHGAWCIDGDDVEDLPGADESEYRHQEVMPLDRLSPQEKRSEEHTTELQTREKHVSRLQLT